MCGRGRTPDAGCMVDPLMGAPRRPVRRLDGSALDVAVLACSLAGVLAAVCFLAVGVDQMCAPDADGLEGVGVGMALGVLVLLLPGALCTFVGLRSARRGGLMTGRVLLLVVVFGWPLVPMMLGVVVLLTMPWIWC